jgi:integrase
MPRAAKPTRLWLEPERRDQKGAVTHAARWVIRDGQRKYSTGCGAGDVAGAQRALADYLAREHAAAEPEPNRGASDILISDVLRYYADDAGGDVKRPVEFVGRMTRLLTWWGHKPLSHITGFSCKAYASQRGSQSAARRELEDLRSAVNLYAADGLLRDTVKVALPEKHGARLHYFTRDQIADLLWYCWRAREVQKGVETDKRHLRHVCAYILAAVYTGSRSARIWNASYAKEVGRPWLDLEGGVYYRLADGEVAPTNKRAGSIRIPERLLAHMRRWKRGAIDKKTGQRIARDYLVEFRGRPADPKKALSNAMDAVFGKEHPYVRHTFRHTCATWLMWSGTDIGDIASYMSMTREMVVDVYGKEHPDADAAVGKAFSSGKAGRRRVGVSRRERPSPAPRLDATETTGTNRDLGAL